ncbi:MAG: heme biosynthesis protein HemY, partial [Woeseiaceae bacterium]
AYFAGLIRTEQHDKAEKEIAAELKREWHGPLVRLFGMIESRDPAKQLTRAEGWLKTHPDDADLLLASARLCLKNELWGKARSYLETAISLKPSPEAYQEYGRLLNKLGEGDAAAEAYKDGLSLVARAPLKALPHLDR